MTRKRSAHQTLRNNLNDFDLNDDEFEDLRMEYEYEHKTHRNPGRVARIAKITGILFLVLASLYVTHELFFPYGPDIASLMRYISASGTILVLLIGLGLLTHTRSNRRRRKKQNNGSRQRRTEYDPDEGRRDANGHHYGKATSGSSLSSGFDEFGYINRKRWYRSRKEKMLFGVCGGIGERFQVDPTIVRALFVLAFFSYGFSFVIYVVLAIVLPKTPLRSVA